MAEDERNEHWSERRRRRVKCKIHGLHYNPDLTAGCSLCRKEGLIQEEARRSRPQLVVMLLALLGVAVSAYRMFGPGMGSGIRAVENEPSIPEVVESRRLAPAAHRTALEAVDQAIFSPAGEDVPEIGRGISRALETLARSLGREPSPEARAVTAEIAELRRSSDRWITPEVIAGLREQWLDLRSRAFEPAPWFRWDIAKASLERVSLTAWRDAANDLVTLIQEAAGRADDLASAAESWGISADDQERIRQDWSTFLAGWAERLEALARGLPQRPGSGAEASLLLATQRFETALQTARVLASGTQSPPQTTVVAAFDRAYDLAAEARRSFESLDS